MTAPQTGTAPATNTGTAPQGGGGGGGDASPAQGAGAALAARSESGKRGERSEHYERLLHRYGTAERVAEVLSGENFDYREAARTDAATIARLSTNQIPEGAVVLKKDTPELTAWEKIKASGVELAKIPDRLALAKTLEGEKAANERAAQLTGAAKAAKLDPLVLSPLVDQFGYTVEVRTEKQQKADKSGLEDVAVAYVRKAGDDKATWTKLTDEISREGSPFKPFAEALKAKGGNTGTATQGDTVTHAFGHERPGDTTAPADGDDVIAKRLAARTNANASRGNPLMPAKAPAAKT